MAADEKKIGQEMPHVVFKVGENKYAVSSDYVLHIQVLEGITPMVGADPYCKGVVAFDGNNIPVYDLQMMFSARDFEQELNELMQARIEDHEQWVAALEQSVEDGTEFTLTTDPHQCEFGKWLDSFETDNSYLELFLKSVDAPHKGMHAAGEKVKQLVAKGRIDEAKEAIRLMRETDFALTKQILGKASGVYRDGQCDMLIILQIGERKLSIAVDSICYIRVLDNLCATPPDLENPRNYVECIAKTKDLNNEEDIVLMLKISMFKKEEALQ
ncbi:CZB domain-containing protein [Christensenellaceae bacterium OttesenSCG-928-K19]|nr:CZB domain-containing protein [Christensenellaceae bacterium OttesenSCG-928-K19]